MNSSDIFMLGLGLQAPWKLIAQSLNTEHSPYELQLQVGTERGELYSCPECGAPCSAHDFKEKTWRHLNFFQHHCYITAKIPRVHCKTHGVKLIEVPWARPGSGFTLLFEEVALTLVREMPVNAAAKFMEVTDKRLWRVVEHYVEQALSRLYLSSLQAFGFDETASKRGHNYVTVFIDMARKSQPVVFAIPGKGKKTVSEFKTFIEKHGAKSEQVLEVVCDMSPSFLSGVKDEFPKANVTVDWFHVVQLFTRAVDEVRKEERKHSDMPKALRWAVLKNAESPMTDKQAQALLDLEQYDLETAKAWRVKEKLRWIREAKTTQAARWRLTNFIKFTLDEIGGSDALEPVRKALATLEKHSERILQRWTSTYTNARIEGLNSLFQAARSRARGYRNAATFITMIYMIASPAAEILKST